MGVVCVRGYLFSRYNFALKFNVFEILIMNNTKNAKIPTSKTNLRITDWLLKEQS